MEHPRPLAEDFRRPRQGRARGHALDRQQLHQGATVGSRWKRGAKAQAIGRSRGGRTTKIHAITDSKGRLFRFLLTPGNVADVTAAYDLTAHLPSKGGLIADMAYDALKLRQELAFRGTASVIPTNPTRKHKWSIDLETYKERNLIERMFCRLKDFRRIATRYDKLARNFASAIALAAVVIWWAD
ncbi:transposase [Labrys wisconsinensis]|uniref:Transposase n=1 Tax=Labrys wisconsinensis TaxID=425677 RepID=A0ABU0J2C2_9HYPH|nr:transposase [Labrys wisconsinensis]